MYREHGFLRSACARVRTWIEKLFFKIGIIDISVYPKGLSGWLVQADTMREHNIDTDKGTFKLRIKEMYHQGGFLNNRQVYIIEIDPPDTITSKNDIDYISNSSVVVLRISFLKIGYKSASRILTDIYTEKILHKVMKHNK